jgi:hypothetical protein
MMGYVDDDVLGFRIGLRSRRQKVGRFRVEKWVLALFVMGLGRVSQYT